MIQRIFSLALLALTLLEAPSARAGGGNEGLAETQRAYAEVDYDRTRRLAKEAIERGDHDRAATGELYLMWGLAAAALEQTEEARSAFLYALAVNPELKLDRSLSPKMRAPYLEARGSAAAADGKSPLELSIKRGNQALELVLRDSLSVAGTLELDTRSDDGASFTKRTFAAASRRIPIRASSEIQAYARVLDRYGNVLYEQGSETDPQRFSLLPSSRPPSNAQSFPTPDVNRAPYLLTVGALAVLGVAAVGVATAMYIRREDAAREWNGPTCEHPGLSRAEQCAEVDDRRRRAEVLSVGFAAAGGALLIGSAVSLWLTPSSRAPAKVSIGAAPGNMMLQVAGAL